MRILVSKLGQSLATQAYGYTHRGEQGTTEGVIRHLMEQGHDVCFFGTLRGELPCLVIESAKDLLDEHDADQQERNWKVDVDAVLTFFGMPDLVIHSTGNGGAINAIRNPRQNRCMMSTVRYYAPCLALLHHLNELRGECSPIPRVLVNTDCRCYPREQEMTLMWPDVTPMALLDQSITHEETRIVAGAKYVRRHVYAGVDRWNHQPRMTQVHDGLTKRVRVLSHCHVTTGYKQAGRDSAWHDVLDGADVDVYGEGWEGWSGYDDYAGYTGSGQSYEAYEDLLLHTMASPVMAPVPGFISSKGHDFLAHGCLPLFYGRDQLYTCDPLEYLVPLGHPTRVSQPGDLARVGAWPEERYAEHVEELRERFRPDWSVLDSLVDALSSGSMRPGDDEWWAAYGGYRRCP